MLSELVHHTRSFRRFKEDEPVSRDTLLELLQLARLSGSARNLQPLKYLISNTGAMNERIFPCLGWAGYLRDWQGPGPGERPAAYIVCLLDTDICSNADVDLGIASQNILLGAAEKGLGGCRIANISPDLSRILNIPEHLEILLVIALGKPAEKVKLTDPVEQSDIRYWRNNEGIHYVPKRPLREILLEPFDSNGKPS